jgi:hypothetical protein
VIINRKFFLADRISRASSLASGCNDDFGEDLDDFKRCFSVQRLVEGKDATESGSLVIGQRTAIGLREGCRRQRPRKDWHA